MQNPDNYTNKGSQTLPVLTKGEVEFNLPFSLTVPNASGPVNVLSLKSAPQLADRMFSLVGRMIISSSDEANPLPNDNNVGVRTVDVLFKPGYQGIGGLNDPLSSNTLVFDGSGNLAGIGDKIISSVSPVAGDALMANFEFTYFVNTSGDFLVEYASGAPSSLKVEGALIATVLK